jgi:hypothetical protein
MQRLTLAATTSLAAFALVCSLAMGQQPAGPAPDKIEEDWQVVLATPDPDATGPQLTTCMSPVSDNSTPFVAFDLNYCDYPSFSPGGLQIKVYSGQNVADSSSSGSAVFDTPCETITWTQRMQLSTGNQISYQVNNGQSTTWGQFGYGQGLGSVGYNTSVSDLSGYNPATSVAKSGAGWESNNVVSMTLVRVRYYSSGVLLSTDNTPRSVSLAK